MARLAETSSLTNRMRSLGFQSKLLIMLLIVSVLSVLVAGLIGYTSGTSSLRDAEFRRLTQLRESRAREITAFYGAITDSATIITHSSSTIDAVQAFGPAFAELQKAPLPPGAEAAVSKYYAAAKGDFDASVKVRSAGDPSEWSKINDRLVEDRCHAVRLLDHAGAAVGCERGPVRRSPQR